MLNGNIFREAKELLRDRSLLEMDGEELIIVKAALIPLNILPEFNDITTEEGLEALARMFDEADRETVAASRRRAEAAHRRHKPKVVRQNARRETQ